MKLPYNDFGSWLRSKFPFKVQKISIDGGFCCPNRNGGISYGGCTFCDNKAFNPRYCDSRKTIREQLEMGKKFFKRKYGDMRYLAYFQAYTNTYGSVDTLKELYEEALNTEDIVGIVIGTRPDCVDKQILDYIESLSRQTFVIVEYGIESANDATLRRINRGHDFECSRKAIEETSRRGIITGGHVILGLPGEDEAESVRQAKIISSTKLDILKIHQLQIIRGTRLEKEYEEQPFRLYTLEEYMSLLGQYIQFLRKDIVLERFVSQAPKRMLAVPGWGLKNYEFTNLLVNYLNKTGAYQGKKEGLSFTL
ncbi:MAG: TIGR01212 family radical SAM protein [Prevotella sp.]|nr:TIGR01212 family radical SAM protein [Prevotella sp.]